MADLIINPIWQAIDGNGDPVPGALATFYDSGTTEPQAVYTNDDLTVPHASPVVANGNGVFPPVFTGSAATKAVITAADLSAIATVDPVPKSPAGDTGAASVSFTPTGALPFSNVQDAIEGAAQSAASGFIPYGLGVTGNAVILANLDATNTASGEYRFDATTTGTFPTGVVAADGGGIDLGRNSAGVGTMTLTHGASDRKFYRRMTGAAWGTWREEITSNQAPAQGDLLYRDGSNWVRLPKGVAHQSLYMNAGLTAPEWSIGYRCRAWGNINGAGGAVIRDSGNVASVVRNALGDYYVNFSVPMPHANYAVTTGGSRGTGDSTDFQITELTTGYFRLYSRLGNENTAADAALIMFGVFC